jgi:hypothetical protein
MMTKSELATKMNDAQAWLPGKRVKIDFGGEEGSLMLDGQANQVIDGGDGAADTTIKVSWADWQAMSSGQLDGMTAFMMGKLKVEATCRTPCNSRACWPSSRADPQFWMSRSKVPSGSIKAAIVRPDASSRGGCRRGAPCAAPSSPAARQVA